MTASELAAYLMEHCEPDAVVYVDPSYAFRPASGIREVQSAGLEVIIISEGLS